MDLRSVAPEEGMCEMVGITLGQKSPLLCEQGAGLEEDEQQAKEERRQRNSDIVQVSASSMTILVLPREVGAFWSQRDRDEEA